MSSRDTRHWLVRVQDGENFRNSKHPFWGVKPRGGGGMVKKSFREGDILWFMTSKPYGGKIIGMAEYTHYFDRNDEPLVLINTYSNFEQGWKGDEQWSIQIHYKNLYVTEKQNITAIINSPSNILDYETWYAKKHLGLPDLYRHYDNFKFYAEPKVF